jgi:broad specificity phosphatase PhoE
VDLVLIRHAEPVRIGEGEVEGPADPELHERGHQQCERLATWLADEHLDAVYASPMQRARQTAAAVAAPRGLDVQLVDDLAEFDRMAGFYIPIEELRATKDPRMQSWADGDFSDVQADPVEFRQRVVAGMDRIIADNPGRTVAVVSHGGVMNAFLAEVVGIDRLLWFDVDYTGICRLVASRSGIRTIVSLNETAHLKGTGLIARHRA